MHLLTIHVERMPPFQLRYRGPETGHAALQRIIELDVGVSDDKPDYLLFQDDYGKTVRVKSWDIAAAELLDVSQDLEAQIVLARQQQEAQERLSRGQNGLVRAPANLIQRERH